MLKTTNFIPLLRFYSCFASAETFKSSFDKTSRSLTTEKETLKKAITARLKELHYPQHTHPALERELTAFFETIGLASLQSKARSAQGDPEQLKQLAEEIEAIFKKEGFLNLASPPPLLPLLVDSFGDEDILAVIEQSPITPQKKQEQKRAIYACSAISQLAAITLDLLDLPIKTLSSTTLLPEVGHTANYIRLSPQEILLLDFTNQCFLIIDLNYWYEQQGQYLALKSQHHLSGERAREIMRCFQPGIMPTEPKEILNLLFFTLNLTDHYSASAMIYNNRGNAYYNKGDLDRAISDFNQALRINPNYADVYNNRGNAYSNKGDLDQAISDYNQALRINPNDAGAYFNRGNAYGKKGDLDQAISDFNQALRINPNCADAYYTRAVVYFLQGDYIRAWVDVRRVQDLGYQVNPEFLQELRRASGR